jgi:hypothetical protein
MRAADIECLASCCPGLLELQLSLQPDAQLEALSGLTGDLYLASLVLQLRLPLCPSAAVAWQAVQ